MASDRVDRAVTLFQSGLSCSQAILATYGPLFGISHDDAFRIARGFGGGMARLSEACGAVTGTVMVLSLSFAGTDKQTREDNYTLIRKYAAEFKEAYGSLNCGCLLGCDLSTAEGQNHFREKGMMQSHCTKYVRHSAEMIEKLLDIK